MNFASIQFAHHSVLIATLLGTIALLVLLLVAAVAAHLRSRRMRMSLTLLAFKAMALCALGLALAGPYRISFEDTQTVYLLVDISESVEGEVAAPLLERVRALRQPQMQMVVMGFAERAGSLVPIHGDLSEFSEMRSAMSPLGVGQTDLAEALRTVLSQDPGSVLLLSDGHQTRGDVRAMDAALHESGFKIFPLTPRDAAHGPAQFIISNLYAPLTVASEKSVDIRVSVQNRSPLAQRGVLEITHGGKRVRRESITVEGGREALFVAKSDPSEEGIKEIKAVLTPEDSRFASSSKTLYLSGESREKVLLVSGSREDLRFLRPALESQSYQLKSYLGSDSAQVPADLSQYSVVVLNNVALRDLPSALPRGIEEFVRGGGGLIMVGGDKSFGLGGYKGTVIEEVLPVSMVPPQTVQKRVNIAMQLVIDKSRSMASGSKLDYAKEAAIEVIENLKDEDLVGVMGFDQNPFVVIPMGQVAQVRAEASRRVGLLWPLGGTSLVGAVDEARRGLSTARAGRKHMIILTDGEITDAPRHYYFELVKQLRLLGITISTVMLGGEGDESMLKQMANLGGGAFYVTNDPRSLPKIFVGDIKVASGERTLKEETDYRVRTANATEKTSDIDSFPSLRGYVQTKVKSKAELELEVVGAESSDPLLARWRYGSGKSIAFTSDANGRWSDRWVGWGAFQRFWGDLIDGVRGTRDPQGDKVEFELVQYVEQGALHLDLIVYSDIPGHRPEIVLTYPDKVERMTPFETAAKGRFHAILKDPLPGRYDLKGKIGRSRFTPVAFYVSGENFGERKGEGFDLPTLNYLAAVTGGKVNPEAEDLHTLRYRSSEREELVHYFLIAALVLLLSEILIREVLGSILRRAFGAISLPQRVSAR